MSVIRNNKFYGGQRIDSPHLLQIDAGVRGDFDVLAGKMLAGAEPLILSGFKLITTGIVGAPATAIQMTVAGSLVLHPTASASGTIFNVPSDRAIEILNSTNPRINGSFTPNAVNYIGIDIVSSADSTTSDTVQFLDIDTKKENAKKVPLADTMDYVIYIGTKDFTSTSGLAPIAIVTTDASNNVTAVQDARNMLFRLSFGGSIPDDQSSFSWADRTETSSSFDKGDKDIGSLKAWADAMMTRVWEIGGGEHWYSATADRNVKMIRTGSPFTSTGDWFEYVSSNLHWQGIKFVFDNSTGYVNEIKDQTTNQAGLTDLADGEVLYVDLDRSQNLTGGNAVQPAKAPLTTLGTPIVPGSRYILAWRIGSNIYTRESTFYVGMTVPVATTSAVGTVKLAYTAGAPAAPVVFPQNANGQLVASLATSNAFASLSATGFNGVGTSGGSAIQATGGSSTTTLGGNGIQVAGGAGTIGNAALSATGGAGTAGAGGNGVTSIGGNSTTGNGGNGVLGTGGTTATNSGGIGVWGVGGTASGAGTSGAGLIATGGAVSGAGIAAGVGATITGGASGNAVDAAIGAVIAGGANTSTGNAGVGATITAGARSNSGSGANALNVTGGAANTSGTGGDGISATSGAGAGSSQGGVAVRATAGGNGGRAGLFVKAITDVSAATTLDATGLTVSKGSSGIKNIAPSLKLTQSTGDETNHFTHLGYPTGQVSKFLEPWNYAAVGDITTAPSIWASVGSFSGGGSTAFTLNDPGNTYAASYISLTATSGTAGEVASRYAATGRTIFPNPNVSAASSLLYLQSEFIVSTSGGAPAGSMELWVGFTDNVTTPDSGTANTAMFRWKGGTDTGTTWYAYTSNSGGGSATDTTVAFSGSGVPDQVLKIEFYGQSTDRGASVGGACVVFTIDGIERVVKTSSIPGAKMKMCFLVKSKTSVSVTKSLQIGGAEVYWNPMLLSTLKR